MPDTVAREASEQEPPRFGAIVLELRKEWNEKHDAALTLKWLSLFNRCDVARSCCSLWEDRPYLDAAGFIRRQGFTSSAL